MAASGKSCMTVVMPDTRDDLVTALIACRFLAADVATVSVTSDTTDTWFVRYAQLSDGEWVMGHTTGGALSAYIAQGSPASFAFTRLTGTAALTVDLATGSRTDAASNSIFRVEVVGTGGTLATLGHVIAPQEGDTATITTTRSPVAYADVARVVVTALEKDGWFVGSCVVSSGSESQPLTLPRVFHRTGWWVSLGNPLLPDALHFETPAQPLPAGGAEVSFTVTSGAGAADGSSDTFVVHLHYADGVFPGGSVAQPASGAATVVSVSNAPHSASDLTAIELRATGPDGWFVRSLEVAGEPWVLPDVGSDSSQWIDNDNDDAPAALRFTPRPAPTVPQGTHSVSIRFTTGATGRQGSESRFPVTLVFADGSTHPAGSVVAPGLGSTNGIDVTGSPQPTDSIAAVVVSMEGPDDWLIASTEVVSGASWVKWVVRSRFNSEGGVWVSRAAGQSATLEWAPPAREARGGSSVELRFTTGSFPNAGTTCAMPILLHFTSGEFYPASVKDAVRDSVVTYSFTDTPQPASKLAWVEVQSGPCGDAWHVSKLEVNANGWSQWLLPKFNNIAGRWVGGSTDDPNHKTRLHWQAAPAAPALSGSPVAAGGFELDLRFTSGPKGQMGSADSFDVVLHNGDNHFVAGSVVPGEPKGTPTLALTNSPWEVRDITSMEVRHAGSGHDPWHIASVEVLLNGEYTKWGIPAFKNSKSRWIGRFETGMEPALTFYPL